MKKYKVTLLSKDNQTLILDNIKAKNENDVKEYAKEKINMLGYEHYLYIITNIEEKIK